MADADEPAMGGAAAARAVSAFRELDDPAYDGPRPTSPPRRAVPAPTVYRVADAPALPREPGYTAPENGEVHLPTFEIGIVLAGAVSAGAYTAGVLDFLIEALDRWEAAKLGNIARFGSNFAAWTVPPHAVRLTAVAGASAGSVCAAILAASAGGRFTPGAGLSIAFDPAGKATRDALVNPLYDVWVRRLDISGLLASADIGTPGVLLGDVQSLFNTTPLDEAARSIVSLALPSAPPRPWLEQGLEFGFTLGNLTGVPYRYRLVGLDGADFATTRHADMFTFRLAGAAEPAELLPENCAPGNPYCLTHNGKVRLDWADVANAALASAAFPVALKPRHISRDVAGYNRAVQLSARYLNREGPVFEADEAPGAAGTPAQSWRQGANVVAGTVNTTLGRAILPFTAVDGGTMNNQPFEYVRRALAGPMGANPRQGHLATRAVVLIDPFPAQLEADASVDSDRPATDGESSRMQPMSVLDVLPRLLKAYINQSRYDANDLSLAADPDVYSRFMLSPVRAGANGLTLTGEKALASGGLGAFAGFLSEAYRHHDFLLGRRNAEYFLRTYFALPQDNERLFDPSYWGRFGTADAPEGPYWTITSVGGRHERQIIPVIIEEHLHSHHQPAVGLGEDKVLARLWAIRDRLLVPHPAWPGSWTGFEAMLARMEQPIEARLRQLLSVLIASLPEKTGWRFIGALARPFLGTLARRGRDQAMRTLRAQLKSSGLDQPQSFPTKPDGL